MFVILCFNWQFKGHDCPLPQPVADNGDGARVCGNYGAGNGQSESCTACLAGTGAVNTVEAVKNMGQMLR